MSWHGSSQPNPASLPLFENGLDFLASAVEHLRSEATPRNLKYAVLHLASGIELVLKERLRQHDPAQIYQDPKKFDRVDYATGDFTGPKTEVILDRLAAAGVHVVAADKADLVQLRKKRNRAEHFHLDDTAAAISASTARTLGFALDFIASEIDTSALSTAASNQLETIRAALPQLEHFVSHRIESIAAKLADAVTAIVECPYCGQATSVLDEGANCQFCGASATAEEGADEYAHLVLGESHYKSSKQGIAWVVSPCPECQADTFVDRAAARDPEAADRWVCFNCGSAWPSGSLSRCDHCDETIAAGDDEITICGDCLSAMILKE